MMTMALELARSHLAKVFSRVGESDFFFSGKNWRKLLLYYKIIYLLAPLQES